MSCTIQVYLDDETEQRFEDAAIKLERSVEDLAEAALAEYMLDWAKRQLP